MSDKAKNCMPNALSLLRFKRKGRQQAAKYLRNQGVSLQEALWILVSPNCKERA